MSGIDKLIHIKRLRQLIIRSNALREMKKETPKSNSVRKEIIENLEILTEFEFKIENALYSDKK